jgi:hypothetical protein
VRGSVWVHSEASLLRLQWCLLCGYHCNQHTWRNILKFEVRRGDKYIPLDNSKVAAIVLVLVLSIVLLWYSSGLIAYGAVGVVDHLIDNAEKHAEKHTECEECDESKRNFVPIEVPDRESKEDE